MGERIVTVSISIKKNGYTFEAAGYFPDDLVIIWKRQVFTEFDSIEDARECHRWLAKLRVTLETWKSETKKAIGVSKTKDARLLPGLEEKRAEVHQEYLRVEKAQQETNAWLMENDREYLIASTSNLISRQGKSVKQ